jgi:hypothetical protein
VPELTPETRLLANELASNFTATVQRENAQMELRLGGEIRRVEESLRRDIGEVRATLADQGEKLEEVRVSVARHDEQLKAGQKHFDRLDNLLAETYSPAHASAAAPAVNVNQTQKQSVSTGKIAAASAAGGALGWSLAKLISRLFGPN